jgi:hypothetical protein
VCALSLTELQAGPQRRGSIGGTKPRSTGLLSLLVCALSLYVRQRRGHSAGAAYTAQLCWCVVLPIVLPHSVSYRHTVGVSYCHTVFALSLTVVQPGMQCRGSIVAIQQPWA